MAYFLKDPLSTRYLVFNIILKPTEQCKNPYPCDFDRGIITTMGRKFETFVKVNVDTTKPSRKEGADDTWYIVS